jgi:DNA (cytosine-5)-methyltransferase 1
MKVLNLYCGIGGNRKLWTGIIEVTAVEIDPEIARVYQELFPEDHVIVTDAHEYLLQHFKEFDFIWSSRPCPSHSKLRLSHPESLMFPDMKLYEEIIFLQHFFKGKWIVENVDPYYKPLILPMIKIDRHLFWSNFKISNFELEKSKKDVSRDTKEGLSEFKNIDLSKFSIKNKRLLLRNAVNPRVAEHIFQEMLK